jgi:hypothetical protein
VFEVALAFSGMSTTKGLGWSEEVLLGVLFPEAIAMVAADIKRRREKDTRGQ